MKRENLVIVKSPPAEALAYGYRIRAWDLAATKDGGDYSVGVRVLMWEEPSAAAMLAGQVQSVIGANYENTPLALLPRPRFYIENVVRFREEPGERDKIIARTAERDGVGIPIVIEQEGGSGGKTKVHTFVAALRGFTVFGEKPTGDIVIRANQLVSQVNVNNVQLVESEWNEDFIAEMELFDKAEHDDQVSATLMAVNALLLGRGGAVAGQGGAFQPLTDPAIMQNQRMRQEQSWPGVGMGTVPSAHSHEPQEPEVGLGAAVFGAGLLGRR